MVEVGYGPGEDIGIEFLMRMYAAALPLSLTGGPFLYYLYATYNHYVLTITTL